MSQCSQYPIANKKLPLSKAQNCCTATTGDWRAGLKHQGKRLCLGIMERISSAKLSNRPHLFSPAVQGGAEHNVPVVISKIFKDQVGKKLFFYSSTSKWILIGGRCSVKCH